MSPHRWALIEALFDEALTLPLHRRTELLARRAGNDEKLLQEVQALLDQAETPARDVLDRPAVDNVSRKGSLDGLAPGTRVGVWRIEELVGRGGMGEVYRAARFEGTFQQRVALKLIRREAVDQLDRFHEERRLLARLDHPGIARLIDGGLAEDGRPYMVMEWVEGLSLTEWCDVHRASLRQRLELFLQVCESVAYAHRNLLVHRDLKPGNVWVTAEARTKLLDFGVAKLLTGAGDETRTYAPMTLAYAAPEQLAQERVTPAADVYALGLLLFELLTGQRPWHRPQMPMAVLIDRQLRQAAPQPSQVAASAGRAAPVTAGVLRGDLDAIVGFALRREPGRRYRSAAELADDLRRYSEGQAVLARPESLAYSLRRFVRRNRAAAAFAGLAVLSLIVGLALSLWQAREARIAAGVAQQEAARATATKDFLLSVFRASDPRIAQGKPRGQVTAKELLDANASRIAQSFANDPETRIDLLGVAASIYRELGDEARYAVLHGQQLELARASQGDGHPAIINGLIEDANRANNLNEYGQALELLDRADPLIRQAGLDGTTIRARWWLVRSDVLKENYEAVDADALDRAVELYEKLAPTDTGYVKALTSLGWRALQTQQVQAEQLFLRAIAVSQNNPESNSGELQQYTYPGLAQAREDMGQYDAAIEAYDRGAALIEQTYGMAHSSAWVPMAQYGWTLHRYGLRERALAHFQRLMANIPSDWTADSYDEYAREFYAACLVAEGRAQAAIPMLEAALKVYREKPSVEYEIRRNRLILGEAYEGVGRVQEAREAIKASLDERIAKEPRGSPTISIARERWARFLLAHDEWDEAEVQFRGVLAQANGKNSQSAVLARGGLARLALLRGEVSEGLRTSAAAVEAFDKLVGRRDVRAGPYLWLIHAEALRRSGKRSESRDWAERALRASRQYDDPDAGSIRQAQSAVAAASG